MSELTPLGGSLPIPRRLSDFTAEWFTDAFQDSGMIPTGATIRVGTCTVLYLSGDPNDPTSGGFTGNELLQAHLTYATDRISADQLANEAERDLQQAKLHWLVASLGLPYSVAIKKFDLPDYYRGQPPGLFAFLVLPSGHIQSEARFSLMLATNFQQINHLYLIILSSVFATIVYVFFIFNWIGRLETWAQVKLARFHPALTAYCESHFYARQTDLTLKTQWKLPTPKIFYNRMDAWKDPTSMDILLWGARG